MSFLVFSHVIERSKIPIFIEAIREMRMKHFMFPTSITATVLSPTSAQSASCVDSFCRALTTFPNFCWLKLPDNTNEEDAFEKSEEEKLTDIVEVI